MKLRLWPFQRQKGPQLYFHLSCCRITSHKPTFYKKDAFIESLLVPAVDLIEGSPCIMWFSVQLSIRTAVEPVALFLLESNERSMLPFIYWSTVDGLGDRKIRACCYCKRLELHGKDVGLLGYPETME